MVPRRASSSFWMNKHALSFGSCFFHFRFPLSRLCCATDCCQSRNALFNPTSVSQSAMCQLYDLWFGLAGTDCERRRTIDMFDFSPHVTTVAPALILHTRRDAIQLHRGRLVRVMTSRPTTQRMTIEYAHTNTNLVMSQNDLLLVDRSLSKQEVMGSKPIVCM